MHLDAPSGTPPRLPFSYEVWVASCGQSVGTTRWRAAVPGGYGGTAPSVVVREVLGEKRDRLAAHRALDPIGRQPRGALIPAVVAGVLRVHAASSFSGIRVATGATRWHGPVPPPGAHLLQARLAGSSPTRSIHTVALVTRWTPSVWS